MKIIKVIIILFVSLFIFKSEVFAIPSMRKCLILPVRDSVGGAIGFKVFSKVERYLKASKWCYYKSNSEIINILSNYKRTLDVALDNPEVLKVVANKTNSGSLIKVNLESLAKGMGVKVKIIGANGKDVLFNQSTEITTDDIDVIAQTVNNWLDVYEKNIPYVGRVVGVLGTQFTVDMGSDAGIYNGYKIDVVRPIKKRRHPFLKEIVDWKTLPVAEAKVFHVGASQSQAKILKYKNETLVQPEDWILISKDNVTKETEKLDYKPIEKGTEFSFGKLGQIGLFLNLGTGSNTVSGGSVKKLGGLVAGVGLEGEIWATREYWVGLDITKSFGSYKKKEGSFQNDSNSLSLTSFKLKAGYRYLPLGFFYGPQVDGYIGIAKYTYGFDNQSNDEIVASSFKGLLLGVKASLPLIKNVRMYTMLDFLLTSKYEEEVVLFGEDDSSPNYNIEIGGSYKYSPNMHFSGGINYLSNKAKFESPGRTVSLKNTSIKFGTIFNF